MQPEVHANAKSQSKEQHSQIDKPSEKKLAVQLLVQAAKPEKSHVILGVLFLFLASALEALGPILGKAFIDHYLLPRNNDIWMMTGILLDVFFRNQSQLDATSVSCQ